MTESTENGSGPGAAGGEGNGGDGPAPLPYERAQRRLRVDGVAFGAAVGRLREAEGWSLRTLSKKSGVPLTTVANIERGDVAAPDAEVSMALALTFGYQNPGALLGAGAAGRAPGRKHDPEARGATAGPGPLGLDGLMEHLVRGVLRGVWSAPGGRAVTLSLPVPGGPPALPEAPPSSAPALDEAMGAAVAQAVQALPLSAAPGGVALSVGLVGVVVVAAGGGAGAAPAAPTPAPPPGG